MMSCATSSVGGNTTMSLLAAAATGASITLLCLAGRQLYMQRKRRREDEVYQPESKRLKRSSFSVESLKSPLRVEPPNPRTPEFVCSKKWKFDVRTEIEAQLDSVDSTDHEYGRVPPMAVVRCSRGGKTRALHEIAKMMHQGTQNHEPISAIYISFNDFSSISSEEQKYPLLALCQRIAFTACRDRKPNENKTTAYEEFRSHNYDIEAEQIEQWLGDTPAILLVDELNNLSELTVKDSCQAEMFGRFIKKNFLAKKGRYFVFSSHVLTTLGFLGEFIDPSRGSTRHVTLQELPLVDNLSTAVAFLNNSLDGAREAIYYGLMPGMIYEKGRGKPVQGKRVLAMERYLQGYLRESTDKENEFKRIVRSLVTGDLEDVPAPLHLLLDGCGEVGSEKIRWVPFHFQYVMESLGRRDETRAKLAAAMAALCRQLLESKELSGDGWEGLFVLFLLARSITKAHEGYFIPEQWFAHNSVEVKHNPYYNTKRPLSQCKNWEQLKEGVIATEAPTISIFYPSHAQFEAYDAIAMYSTGRKIVDVYGYQLKEGKANLNQPVRAEFTKSFVIKGSPPVSTVCSNHGWSIPTGAVIDIFFGNSGMHWTPQEWSRLSSTCGQESL